MNEWVTDARQPEAVLKYRTISEGIYARRKGGGRWKRVGNAGASGVRPMYSKASGMSKLSGEMMPAQRSGRIASKSAPSELPCGISKQSKAIPIAIAAIRIHVRWCRVPARFAITRSISGVNIVHHASLAADGKLEVCILRCGWWQLMWTGR